MLRPFRRIISMESPDASTLTLGLDVGGTSLRMGAVDAAGALLALSVGKTPALGDPTALKREIERLYSQLHAQMTLSLRANLRANGLVGVCLPGVFNRFTHVMTRSVNLPLLEDVPLAAFFADTLTHPVVLETDVNAAALAQWRMHSPRADRFIYLSLGSGVGGGVVLGGELVRHTNGGGGHFGFLIVDTAPDAPSRLTRIRGCLSEFMSGAALQGLPASGMPRHAQALSTAFLQLTHLYAPNVIALGGGVAEHHAQLIEHAIRLFEAQNCLIEPRPQVVLAKLPSDHAGVIGAALLARAQC
jgi:glucokinase